MRFTLHFAMRLVGFVAIVAAASSANAAAVYYTVQTGMQGRQTQIDREHTSTWTFTTGKAWVFGGGTFEMKDGPSTDADITLSIYDGGNSLVAARTLTNAAFSQSFKPISFLFKSPIELSEDTTYSVRLTSDAPDRANRQYFIKGADSTLEFMDGDESSNPIPSGFLRSLSGLGEASQTDVPEPMTLSLLSAGLAGVAVCRVRRRRAS